MDHPAVELKDRTQKFALRVVKVVRSLPSNRKGRLLGGQLLRSSTSVAANYRAVCRARSRPELLAQLTMAIEEADGTAVWLEFLVDSGFVPESRLKELVSEANQRVAIFNASRTSAKKGVHSTLHHQNSTIPQSRVS